MRKPPRLPKTMSSGGFTLVEVLLVVALMGIMMSITMPRIDIARFRVDAGVRGVASTISRYRGQAIVRQYDFVLTFDVQGDRIHVLHDVNNNGTADQDEERVTVLLTEAVAFGLGGATALNGASEAISFTKRSESLPALTFRRSGAASEEGTVYITAAKAARLGGWPELTRALVIERSTGSVHCSSYRTLVWVEGC
jgi:prepilin-type N-terminal cleavage/methylation domain-containing protein